MSEPLSDDDLAGVRALIEQSSLRGIFYHELSAARFDVPATEIDPNNGQMQVGVQYRLDSETFGVRMNGTLRTQIGEARVAVAAEYDLRDGHQPTKRDVLNYANEVAVMSVFPYLRQAFADITLRVFGEAVLLPVAQRGQIGFDVATEMSAETSEALVAPE